MKFEKKQPTEDELETMGVSNWGIWTKEISSFPWEYDTKEIFYVLRSNFVHLVYSVRNQLILNMQPNCFSYRLQHALFTFHMTIKIRQFNN